jgi:hypothetical protein
LKESLSAFGSAGGAGRAGAIFFGKEDAGLVTPGGARTVLSNELNDAMEISDAVGETCLLECLRSPFNLGGSGTNLSSSSSSLYDLSPSRALYRSRKFKDGFILMRSLVARRSSIPESMTLSIESEYRLPGTKSSSTVDMEKRSVL